MNKLSRFTILAIAASFTLVACSSKVETPEKPAISNDMLAEVDGGEYLFYYPNYFEEYANPSQEVSYISTVKNVYDGGNNIGFTVTESGQTGAAPTQEDCQDLADNSAGILNGDILEVSTVLEGNHVGCFFKIDVVLQDLNLVSENKFVLLDQQENAKLYGVNITYEKDAEEKEIQDLRDGMNKFEIK